jgi:uroporphyrinogen decarboxylase
LDFLCERNLALNSKERVKACMAHQKTDRIPINFRATDEIVRRLAKFLNTDYFGILHHYQIDFREIIPPYIGPTLASLQDGSEVDIWGVGRRAIVTDTGRDVAISVSPLQGANSVEEVKRHPWPKADWFDFAVVKEMVKEYGEYAISTPGIHIEGYHGVLHLLTYLFGMENAMMLLVTEPEMVMAAIEEIMKFFIGYYERIFEAGSGFIDFLFYKDDFGAQNNLLISQTMFREFFFSNIKELSDLAGSFGANFILHSCGSVMKLIPDFIEAGVKVLDPIQVTAKEMDIRKLKQNFGQRLTFHGGIDVQRLMPFGTINEITSNAKETIEVLGHDGGYFFSPSHRFQPDTPIENIAALYSAAFKYGACV